MDPDGYGAFLGDGIWVPVIASFGDDHRLYEATIQVLGDIARADPRIRITGYWLWNILGAEMDMILSGMKLTLTDTSGKKFIYILHEHHEVPGGLDWYEARWPD